MTTTNSTATKKAETTSAKVEKQNNKELNAMQEKLDALATQNANLAAQNELLMKMFMELKNSTQQNNVQATPVANDLWTGSYTLVHLVDVVPGATTHIELSNTTIDMSAFGEERLLTRAQCEELAGKYRRWFERGIIAFGANAEKLAENFNLKTVKDYSYLSKDFVERLGILSLSDLESLYNKVSKGHKDFIIQYFKRKIVDGDPAFKNIHKVEMLNRVSEGAMEGALLDLQREKEKGAKK